MVSVRSVLARLAALAALLVALLPAARADASAWVRAPGDGYVKLGVAHYASPQSESGQTANLKFTSLTFDAYAEVGLPFDLQLVFGVPFRIAMHDETNSDLSFIHRAAGDLRLELDRAVVRGQVPVAVGVETLIPLYQAVAEYDEADGLDPRLLPSYAARFPDVGDGVVSVTPKVLVGWSHNRAPVWISSELGPRFRVSDLEHGVWGSVDLGGFVAPRILALGVYTNADVAFTATDDRRRQSSASAQGYVMVMAGDAVPGLALRLAAGGVYWADGASRGRDLSAGVAWEF